MLLTLIYVCTYIYCYKNNDLPVSDADFERVAALGPGDPAGLAEEDDTLGLPLHIMLRTRSSIIIPPFVKLEKGNPAHMTRKLRIAGDVVGSPAMPPPPHHNILLPSRVEKPETAEHIKS
jgi:hypothetical protein